MDNTWAVVNNETGLIVNAVMWDGGDNWVAPEGHTAYRAWPIYIGWLWNDGVQVDPNPPEEALE